MGQGSGKMNADAGVSFEKVDCRACSVKKSTWWI